MRKIIWTLGIIAGIISISMPFFFFYGDGVDMEHGELAGYVTMIVALSVIFVGIKTYRDKHLSGFISFGKAFRIGLYISLVASTVYVASWMVMSQTIAKDFMSEYVEQSVLELQKSGKPQTQIDTEIKDLEEFRELYKNPIVKAGVTYMEILPVGLLISLIAAALLKRPSTKNTEISKATLLLVASLTVVSCSTDRSNEQTNQRTMSEQKPKVTGVGGIFFRCEDPEAMRTWYGEKLGLAVSQYGSSFEFRNANRPDEINYLQWSPFPEKTDYFAPSEKQFMVNYRVQHIEKLVDELKEAGVTVVDEIEAFDYGKFVHIMDPEGNKIELWEPVDSVFTAMGGETTK